MSYFEDDLDKQLKEITILRISTKNFTSSFKKVRRQQKIKSGTRPTLHYKKVAKEIRYEKRHIRKLRRAERKAKKLLKIGVRKGKETNKYEQYIQGKIWEKRRNEFYRTHAKLCSICRSANYVNLHHAVYANFGEEKDEHLFPLCRSHHKKFHEKYGVKGNMLKETKEFIESLC